VPKLPADFVKAPVFDNPLRPTTGKLVIADGTHELVVRFAAAEWSALEAAAGKDGVKPEALVRRLVEDWLSGGQVRSQPATAAADPRGLRSPRILAQLVGRVQEHLTSRFGWVRKILATA
jgi:hypothetical protein